MPQTPTPRCDGEVVTTTGSDVGAGVPQLDGRTRALVCLGALIATGGDAGHYRRRVAEARAAGATDDEVVGTLLAVGSTIGMASLVSATGDLALGLGYDVEGALEMLTTPPPPIVRRQHPDGNGASS
jgi:alkylhydroperoxidase/carboxymuconolactone decarboxylase family protein YurZ